MAIKQPAKFFLKALLISFILILFLSIEAYLADEGLRKSSLPLYNEWNNLYRPESAATILIQGSSHARVQISPLILDSMLQTTSYNCGIDGYMFDVHYARSCI